MPGTSSITPPTSASISKSSSTRQRYPRHPASLFQSELRYDHPSGFWIAPGLESAPSIHHVNSENTARATGYTLGNIRAGYSSKPFNLEALFVARHLADKQYVAAAFVDSADGRSFYGGVRWKW
ncbi:MAG TPA: hypothetical protein VLA17_12965 [Candidatus Limnocylindria bacterium]|nr:hypothetical protein [Candidatus Limnocylindria bacterium]